MMNTFTIKKKIKIIVDKMTMSMFILPKLMQIQAIIIMIPIMLMLTKRL